ncbi:MAG: hypothetical protein ACFFCV_02280 [Promethearchaeota archaeon]
MPYNKWNYTQTYIKILLVFLILSQLFIPFVLSIDNSYSSTEIYNSNLEISSFSKEDYKPILSEEKQGLGNITINNIDFSGLEIGFYRDNTSYPLIWEEYASGALNMVPISMQFLETIEPAIVDNLDEDIEDNNIITVKINESLMVELDNSTLGYIIYHSRLSSSRLVQFFVDNGTNVFELTAETDYSIDSNEFIVFHFVDFFEVLPNSNFTMNLIWEYDFTLNNWKLSQLPKNDLLINEVNQNFTVDFNYNFELVSNKYNLSIADPVIYAENIYVALTVNLPDRNSLNDHSLELNDVIVNINNYLNLNKTIDVYLSDLFSGDRSTFSLNFTALFTFEFVKAVGETWAIDRLVEGREIRERIYFPSIISGPPHIFLKGLSFYEPTIYSEQVIGNSSLFERNSPYYYLNKSLTGREGMLAKVPYLVMGETCPFIFKYISTQTLRLIITDNIKMPLIGADLEVYYFGQKYGTYISKDQVQPISPGKTNENGEIIIKNIPYGNYTIKVFQNGDFLTESDVNTYTEINYIYTSYPHFPLWIIIFGGLNSIILIFGVIFYLKNKKMR